MCLGVFSGVGFKVPKGVPKRDLWGRRPGCVSRVEFMVEGSPKLFL